MTLDNLYPYNERIRMYMYVHTQIWLYVPRDKGICIFKQIGQLSG